MTNGDVEAHYYNKINTLIRNRESFEKPFDMKYLKKNLDCTIHIEVERKEKVTDIFLLKKKVPNSPH